MKIKNIFGIMPVITLQEIWKDDIYALQWQWFYKFGVFST